ncbi:uncharacterized protein [Centruroides vittatus]|uniref:uncharacterized protein n=1 Tax=Centruroides vittatus TaxID=120091 RepID=UPI00350FBC56
MDRWVDRVALVTGASTGIGASICKGLVRNGMKVVGCARNVDAIEKIAEELSSFTHGELLPIKCDLTNELEILHMFQEIKKHYGRIDVCINNAGLSKNCPLMSGNTDHWRNLLDVNVLALCICTREAIKLMKEKEIDDGQIIHISSVLGCKVITPFGSSFYCGTKHMVNALAEGLRQELREEKSKIRVCCISPALVKTEFISRMVESTEIAQEFYESRNSLQPENVAETVLNVLKMPKHVDINDIIIQTTLPSIIRVSVRFQGCSLPIHFRNGNMDRWMNRVALVTGASAGIGASICKELVKNGMKVVGCARNVDAIKKIAEELASLSPGELLPIKCDLNNDSEILGMFEEIRKRFGRIDVCINNAGLSFVCPLMNGSTEKWRELLQVNVLALCICTREAIKLMREKGIEDGQIIHISSMSAYRVTGLRGTNFYAGTKHMVRALAEGLRQELRAEKSKIRVCCISPGMVETEFWGRMIENPELGKEKYKGLRCLQADDIAKTVLHVLEMPEHVDINDILVRPTEQQS